jgi:hypothetical protein
MDDGLVNHLEGRKPMHIRDVLSRTRSLLARVAGPIVLLVIALANPESRKVLTLRGLGGIESEIKGAQAAGYYERLLDGQRAQEQKPDSKAFPPGFVPFVDSGIVERVAGYQRLKVRPGLEMRWNDTVFRTNSFGCRGSEIRVPKPPRTFRVVVLGSSNTMGHGVHDHDVYTSHIQHRLDVWSGAEIRFEVVNLAIAGDSPTQRLLRLQNDVPRLEPDWILSDVTVLDYSLEELHLKWVVDNGVEVPLDFVRKALNQAGVSPADSPQAFHDKLASFSETLMDACHGEWAATARRFRVPFSVVLLPRADIKAKNPNIIRQLKGMARKHGLACIDLSQTFEELEIEAYRIAPWEPHPNALGHKLISERLSEALLDHDEFTTRVMKTGPYRPFSERIAG